MTTCPVCGSPGADAHSIGTSTTIFCCAACLTMVLRTFAQYAPVSTRRDTGPTASFPLAS